MAAVRVGSWVARVEWGYSMGGCKHQTPDRAFILFENMRVHAYLRTQLLFHVTPLLTYIYIHMIFYILDYR
jgi:hypothetical protein